MEETEDERGKRRTCPLPFRNPAILRIYQRNDTLKSRCRARVDSVVAPLQLQSHQWQPYRQNLNLTWRISSQFGHPNALKSLGD